MAQQTFTRKEVINKLNLLLEQHAPSLMDAITNEHTDFDGEELLILAEQTTKPMVQQTADPKLIDSMALRYRHDFGFLDEPQKEAIRTKMKQLWEEVVGLGFYKPRTAQQTAVEWFFDKLKNHEIQSEHFELYQQAKKIEREQHEKTWMDSTNQFANDARMDYPIFFDDYYTKTYGK